MRILETTIIRKRNAPLNRTLAIIILVVAAVILYFKSSNHNREKSKLKNSKNMAVQQTIIGGMDALRGASQQIDNAVYK